MTKRASATMVLLSCLLTQTGWGQESQPASQPAKEDTTQQAVETALDLASQVDWDATLKNAGAIAGSAFAGAGDLMGGALQGVSGIGGLVLTVPYHLRLGIDGAMTLQNYLSYDKRLVRFVGFPNAGPQLALGLEFSSLVVDLFVGGSLGADLMTYQDLHLAAGYGLTTGAEIAWKMSPGYATPKWIFGLQAAYVRHGIEIKDLGTVSLASDGLLVSATGRIRPSHLPSLGVRAGLGAERVQTHLPDGKFFETYGVIAQVGVSVSFEWTNARQPAQAESGLPTMSDYARRLKLIRPSGQEPVAAPAQVAPPPSPPPAKQEERKQTESGPAAQPASQPASQPTSQPASETAPAQTENPRRFRS